MSARGVAPALPQERALEVSPLPGPTRWDRHGAAVRATLSVLVGLLLWELVARYVVDNDLFLVPLSKIGGELITIARSGTLARYVVVSFQEFIIGFALAAAVGVGLGLAMAVNRSTRDVFDPWVAALQATPLIALGPLFVLWFGLGPISKIAVVFVVAVFSIVINTYAGIMATPGQLIEAARSFGASRWQTYFEVMLPSAMPMIVAGLRIGVGRALLGVVVGELFASKEGLGYLILSSSQQYNTAGLFVGVFLFALAGVVSNRLLLLFEERIAPWQRTQRLGI